MIFVDYKPVLAHTRDYEYEDTKIVFTDSAYSEPSTVFMDRLDAPLINTRVWVQIVDTEQPSQENPWEDEPTWDDELGWVDDYFLSSRWMWVDGVIAFDLANRKEDGNWDIDEWRSREGIVQVILKEHKAVLTRRLMLDDINIIDHFNLLVQENNTFYEFLDDYINFKQWSDIADLLFTENVKLDFDETVTHYPPTLPLNCPWKERTFTECLDNLLRNYDCRILEKTLITADKEYFEANGMHKPVEPDEVLTQLVWTKRKEVELDTDLKYTRLAWPVNLDEIQEEENTEKFYSFFHQLFPEHGDTAAYDSNKEVLDDYLAENRVGYLTYFEFETDYLYPEYFINAEWSQITLYPLTGRRFNVIHLPRKDAVPTDKVSFEWELYSGVIIDVESDYFWIGNLKNISTGEFWTSPTPIRIPGQLPVTARGFAITGYVVLGNFIVATSKSVWTDKNYKFENGVDVLWLGEKVTDIYHDSSVNLTAPDSEIAFESDSEKANYLLNYTISDVEDIYNVRKNEFEVGLGYGNTNTAWTSKEATITFRLINQDRQSIIDYLEATSSESYLDRLSPDWLNTIADLWLENLAEVSFRIRQSRHPYKLEWHVYTTIGTPADNVDFFTGVEPDLNPVNFYGPNQDTADNFPYTFSTDIDNVPAFYSEPNIFLKPEGNLDVPFNFIGIKNLLWYKYYLYLRKSAFTLSIVTEPL